MAAHVGMRACLSLLLVQMRWTALCNSDRHCMAHCENPCHELNGESLPLECGLCDAKWACHPDAIDWPPQSHGESTVAQPPGVCEARGGQSHPSSCAADPSRSEPSEDNVSGSSCDTAVGGVEQCEALTALGYCTRRDVAEHMWCHCHTACTEARGPPGQPLTPEWERLSLLDVYQEQLDR